MYFWLVLIASNLLLIATNIQRTRKKSWKASMALAVVLLIVAIVLLVVRYFT